MEPGIPQGVLIIFKYFALELRHCGLEGHVGVVASGIRSANFCDVDFKTQTRDPWFCLCLNLSQMNLRLRMQGGRSQTGLGIEVSRSVFSGPACAGIYVAEAFVTPWGAKVGAIMGPWLCAPWICPWVRVEVLLDLPVPQGQSPPRSASPSGSKSP